MRGQWDVVTTTRHVNILQLNAIDAKARRYVMSYGNPDSDLRRLHSEYMVGSLLFSSTALWLYCFACTALKTESMIWTYNY